MIAEVKVTTGIHPIILTDAETVNVKPMACSIRLIINQDILDFMTVLSIFTCLSDKQTDGSS